MNQHFERKECFSVSELRSSVRISHGSKNFGRGKTPNAECTVCLWLVSLVFACD